MESVKNILFVCLGNICRSAAAEAVMKHVVAKAGLSGTVHVDSAGTGDYHIGDRADSRMIAAAAARGYDVDSRARQISVEDLDRFDMIVTMDRSNYSNVIALCTDESQKAKVVPFIGFVSDEVKGRFGIDTVPDPYFGGADGFELVLDVLEDGCPAILEKLIC